MILNDLIERLGVAWVMGLRDRLAHLHEEHRRLIERTLALCEEPPLSPTLLQAVKVLRRDIRAHRLAWAAYERAAHPEIR